MNDATLDSWTGGQYSLCRAWLGLLVAGWFGITALHAAALAHAALSAWGPAAIAMAGVLAGILFAAGAFDRLAGGAILLAAGILVAEGLLAPGAGGLVIAGLFALHVVQPTAPYLSLAAIGRVDPGGGWAPRPWWVAAVWGLFAVAQVAVAIGHGEGGAPGRASGGAFLPPGAWAPAGMSIVRLLPALLAAAAAFQPRVRGVAFAALALVHLSGLTHGGGGSDAAFLVGLPFAIDPRWFGAPGRARGAGGAAPGSAAASHDLIFYDGDCGLCHRAVRFLVAEDRDGHLFRYAPLGGGEAARRLGPGATASLPDSIVLLPGGVPAAATGGEPGRTLVRSAAVLYSLERLGGFWRAFALAGRLVPRPIGDALYDAIARVRKRLFAAPRAACPLLPPGLRARFILDEPGATQVPGATPG